MIKSELRTLVSYIPYKYRTYSVKWNKHEKVERFVITVKPSKRLNAYIEES